MNLDIKEIFDSNEIPHEDYSKMLSLNSVFNNIVTNNNRSHKISTSFCSLYLSFILLTNFTTSIFQDNPFIFICAQTGSRLSFYAVPIFLMYRNQELYDFAKRMIEQRRRYLSNFCECFK